MRRFLHITKDRDLHWSRLGFGFLGVFISFAVEEPTRYPDYRYRFTATLTAPHVSTEMEVTVH